MRVIIYSLSLLDGGISFLASNSSRVSSASDKHWGAGREVMGTRPRRSHGNALSRLQQLYSPWTTEQNIRMQRYGDGDGRLFLRCDLQLHAQITFLSQLRTCYTRLKFMQSTSASVNSAVRWSQCLSSVHADRCLAATEFCVGCNVLILL